MRNQEPNYDIAFIFKITIREKFATTSRRSTNCKFSLQSAARTLGMTSGRNPSLCSRGRTA
jgi:hypothetical protein